MAAVGTNEKEGRHPVSGMGRPRWRAAVAADRATGEHAEGVPADGPRRHDWWASRSPTLLASIAAASLLAGMATGYASVLSGVRELCDVSSRSTEETGFA